MEDSIKLDKGLTTAEAAVRLQKYGENVVNTKKRLRPLVAFVKKFNSPLLIILMCASVISFFTGNKTSAIILVCMIFLSVILDFVNTYRSERAVDSLVSKVITTATVIRDGQKQECPLGGIVPDDTVFLSAGDVVPADCLVLHSKDFFVNQSTLTGESLPVAKTHLQTVMKDQPFNQESSNAVLMGTSVVTGFATAKVIRTGSTTEFGKIAERLTANDRDTDFERSLRKFSMFIMKLTFVMVCFVFVVNAFVGRGWFESFVFAIAIAVGLTPELLPVIMTVSLSRGAVRMSHAQVIVKHLPAIQNFGRMQVLCTDKTGTLTENRITVVQYVDIAGRASEEVLRVSYYNSVYHTGVPNPLDQAVKDYRTWDLQGVRKIDEIPFDFERRRESIVIEEQRGRVLITKGAPEAIFPICSTFMEKGKVQPTVSTFLDQAQAEFARLSTEGFKVLAVATRQVPTDATVYEKEQEHDMTFVGFVAFLDPPKESAREAIDALERLGVEVKILTGDNELLTQKICQVIDIPVKGVVTGAALHNLSALAFQKLVQETTIFARITPDQKEKIILGLQEAGKVVGYLGDGINDAPALKAADVGVSVNNAVDVAKETADIILLKKSLRVLSQGIIEGRRTFRNTMKYIMMGLSSNFGNMFSMMAASAFLPFLPMLPTQVLLNNFMYDSSQLFLSSDRVDDEDVTKPSVFSLRFIRRYMFTFGLVSSLFDFLTFGLLGWFFWHSPQKFQTGWFIESLATQVFVIYIIRTRKIPFFQSRPSRMLLVNTFLMVTLAWVLPYIHPVARAFHLEPLPPGILAAVFGFVVLYLGLVQWVKQWFLRLYQPA